MLALSCLALWVAAAPPGQGAAPAAPAVETPVSAPAKAAGVPVLGAMMDVGVPDGAGVSVVVRPWRWLRLQAGGLHNSVAPGLRGGVTLLPLGGWMTPTATVEGGHYFAGNANALAQAVTGNPGFSSRFLDSVQYDFFNAHLGVELGWPRRFVFLVHAGYSHVEVSDHSFAAGLNESTRLPFVSGPATAALDGPSAKLGFILYVG